MDPESEKYYMEELEKQHKADLEVKAILQDFEARHEVMATIISDVSSGQAAMATNISDITNRQEVMATDVSAVSARQAVMATNINNITTRQETTTRDMDHLKDDVAAIKDTVNVISANTSHVKETAEARINKEKENLFYPNKGFRDAKVKLQKNRVVVIKGNTGDGKTAIAVQLLRWLSQEQGAGKPLQLNEIKKLDLLAPNLKLITFIDDIFGEKDVSITDVQEWNKRISNVETLFVDKQAQTNFLIITVRNEIYNSLKKRSLGIILTKDNIIDLSSQTYKIAEEKKELLELYKPKNFSWTDEEKTQISTYAPNIGFPQCCQLFYNSEELQKERVNFFENPFHFLNEALSRLKECSALLYLFLNNGMIRVNDLDPNSKKVHETLLEQAFSIKLIDGNKYKYHTATSFFDKIGKM
ncbi:uncharacterized protein LOC110448366 isoform X2 [Mizuhopecten yessoensis]|uniref:uncharacterized protein LOC110448366 isoform X2 n=1 Tax=Mizuhopecten yessoensis TaxID=6573 RepID=UPI000B45C5F6|nr:uncharacterized protein LOC110448366 isoform X2 [Mizuhopecten yessoensis]